MTTRRDFLRYSGLASGVVIAGHMLGWNAAEAMTATSYTSHSPQADQDIFPYILPPLPYAIDALEPVVSRETLEFHHGKHHKAYLDKLNELVKGTALEGLPLEILIIKTANQKGKEAVFNNAAQVWNHSFFWHSMRPDGGGVPIGTIAEKIKADFGSYDAFKTAFVQAGSGQFGSGWVWLVLEKGKLKIVSTSNADLPMVYGRKALLTCDVWEHAYYLDYQNRRVDFLTAFLEKLVNWEFANRQLNT